MYTRCWRAETSLFLLLCRGLVCEKKRKEKRNCSDWFGRTMERERDQHTRSCRFPKLEKASSSIRVCVTTVLDDCVTHIEQCEHNRKTIRSFGTRSVCPPYTPLFDSIESFHRNCYNGIVCVSVNGRALCIDSRT